MKITKEEFNELYNDNVTKLRYDDILSKIDTRVWEIVECIATVGLRGWYDYSNCDYGKEGPSGWFDPKKYKERIYIGGEDLTFPEPYEDNSFPTRWLWEDYEPEFQRVVYDAEMLSKQKKLNDADARENRKLKKAKMKEIITSKLTKEELKYIKFK